MTYIESIQQKKLDPLKEFSRSNAAGILSIALQFHFGEPTPEDGIHSVLLIAPTKAAKSAQELFAFAQTLPEAQIALSEEQRVSDKVSWIPRLNYSVAAAQLEILSTFAIAESLPLQVKEKIRLKTPGYKETIIPHSVEVRVYPRTTLAQAVASQEVQTVRSRRDLGFSVSIFDREKQSEDISTYDWHEWRYFDSYIPPALMNKK